MKKFTPLLIVSLILGFFYLRLYLNYEDRFNVLQQRYDADVPTAINLAKGCDSAKLVTVLKGQGYVSNTKDAKFIASQLIEKLNSGNELSALYDLNKRAWMVNASRIDSFCKKGLIDTLSNSGIKNRLEISKGILGQDDVMFKKGGITESSVVDDNSMSGEILVTVLTKEEEKPVEGVVVRLSVQHLDSGTYVSHSEPKHYLKTDANGQVRFRGLSPDSSYSVLPIREYYEYGSSKGTIGGSLAQCTDNGVLKIKFAEQEHAITLFNSSTIKAMKEDASVTVRSPQQFSNKLMKYMIMFFGAWWLVFLTSLGKRKRLDSWMYAAMMSLTGVCLLTMFSINNPLSDKLLGEDMAWGVFVGVIVLGLLLRVDFVKLYQGRIRTGFDLPIEIAKWLFKPYRRKVKYLTEVLADKKKGGLAKLLALLVIIPSLLLLLFDLIQMPKLSDKVERALDKAPKGSGYLFAALFLTLLLFTPLGAEVGGMKVNLNLGILFQPSEIAKYLIVFFMASFFCINANKLIKYSADGNWNLMASKAKMMGFVFAGLGVLLVIYLGLGDMGPALVLTFTFILMYSIIKSKVELGGASEKQQIVRILTCDVAMLVYGVASFALFLYFGSEHLKLSAFLWLVIWLVIGGVRKQIFESALFFNLVIFAFVAGPEILGEMGVETVKERLESRTEMCTNTWGTLPDANVKGNPGENTQVVHGLWALASGGFTGQGFGMGAPHVVPAFHTDMVLESVGEQMGFVGIVVVIFLLAFLLRRAIVVGYNSSHPFAFYLCIGIAIVTAVQFIIISLGSTGVIPLTGVTVPFLSYGKVSMILNIAAFGIVMSISRNNSTIVCDDEEVRNLQQKEMNRYAYPVSLVSLSYCALSLFIGGVFFYYQCIARDEVIVKPVYVNNISGIPVIEYNPRIGMVTKKMASGDIFDRNGVLIATSDREMLDSLIADSVYRNLGIDVDIPKIQRRYYPFGEHLFFMLGDLNTGDLMSSRGFMAEDRYMSRLRGYDNAMYERDSEGNVKLDENGDSIKVYVNLVSKEYRPDKYHDAGKLYERRHVARRDYGVLKDALKAGLYSKSDDEVKEFAKDNNLEPSNIYLTVDAQLQTEIQKRMVEYIPRLYTHRWSGGKLVERSKESKALLWKNKARASVVILDANKGDLLASANYPMLDMDRLKEESEKRNYYTDNRKDTAWRAYVDMDLGLLHPTAPGSTAKVITSIAALKAENITGENLSKQKYFVHGFIHANEKILKSEPDGNVDWRMALRESSNCYFINLVNDKELYDEMASVYGLLGLSISTERHPIKPAYTIDYAAADNEWIDNVLANTDNSIKEYQKYTEKDKKGNYILPRKQMNKAVVTNADIPSEEWAWSWGQGGVVATPLVMARAASIAVNDGNMAKTRFLMDEAVEQINVIDSEEAYSLKENMIFTSRGHDKIRRANVGGKTGTPERGWIHPDPKFKTEADSILKPNDAWYMCFVEGVQVPRFDKATGETVRDNTNLAIAVRLERTGDAGGSGRAVDVLKDIVFEVLEELGYVEKVKNESYYDRRGITSGWGEEYINRGQYHKFKLEQ